MDIPTPRFPGPLALAAGLLFALPCGATVVAPAPAPPPVPAIVAAMPAVPAPPAPAAPGQAARRPVLGVVLAPDDTAGVRIAGVTPGSAAQSAGLRSGDRLLAVDGHAVLGSNGALRLSNARRLLGGLEAGRAVRLAYARGGERRTASVTPKPGDAIAVWMDGRRISTTGLAPGADCRGPGCAAPALLEAFRWNGLNLATVGPALGRYFGTTEGVLVLSAGEALGGLQPGDVIRKVGDARVATPREAMDALRRRKPGSEVALEVLRDRTVTRAMLTVPAALPAPPAMAAF